MANRDDYLHEDETVRRRVLIVYLDGEKDGEVKYLMMRLKDRLRSQGMDVDSWIEHTVKPNLRQVREAWRKS